MRRDVHAYRPPGEINFKLRRGEYGWWIHPGSIRTHSRFWLWDSVVDINVEDMQRLTNLHLRLILKDKSWLD